MVRTPAAAVVPVEHVESFILVLRGQRVMIDADLARLYGVTTKRLNEQVKRNVARFPAEFMFRLNRSEKSDVVANCDHLRALKFSPQLPYAFTEHGAIMAATVLNSPKAVKVSVLVVRAFVRLRKLLATHHELAAKLDELESKLKDHDQQIMTLMEAIRELLDGPEATSKPPIGFVTEERDRELGGVTNRRRRPGRGK